MEDYTRTVNDDAKTCANIVITSAYLDGEEQLLFHSSCFEVNVILDEAYTKA